MTKLLFITAGLYFDPTDTSTRLRYESLSDAGFSGLVLCVVYDHKHSNQRIGNFQLTSLYLPPFFGGYGTVKGLLRALYYSIYSIWKGVRNKNQFDVSVSSDPFKSGLLCYVISKLINKPYIVEVAGNYIRSFAVNGDSGGTFSHLKQIYVKKVSPVVLQNAAAIKLLYEEQIDELATLNDLSKIHVFHDITAYYKFHPSSTDDKFILSVGHPWHLKGMDLLIQAFNKINHKIPDYKLHIVGYSPDKSEFAHLAADNPNIILSNKGMPFDNVVDLFQSCSLFVLASRTEAMGRVLLEAMASAKPVLASRIDGIPRIVDHGKNGLLFEPCNIDELAEKMLLLLTDVAYANKLAQRGLTDTKTKFSSKAFIENYQNMVCHVITTASLTTQ